MTQAQALDILKSGANVFLTGAPGSGKTHTIGQFVEWLRSQKKTVGITASTGIAATQLGGVTVHSWSGIGIKDRLTPRDLKYMRDQSHLVKRARAADVLIIDEVSMLSSATLTVVNEACKSLRQSRMPFGGMQVVLVGDFFQLPPVVRREPGTRPADLFGAAGGDASHFAFSSPAWHELELTVCYLTEQHRQADASFLDLLSAIREERVDLNHEELLTERLTKTAPPGVTKLFSHNRDVDKDNARQLARLEGEEFSFFMDHEGPEALTKHLVRGCMSPEVLELKEGARVMFTRNDFNAGFVNGTIGTVMGFEMGEEDMIPVVETDDGNIIEVEPAEWKLERDDEEEATISQVPLRLAWAITVHKSQGMSLDSAYMDLSRTFEYGQGYVALSRVRSLAGLHLAGVNDRSLKVHPLIVTADRAWRPR